MDSKKSVYSRIDTLQQYYNTAFDRLSNDLALTRFMDRSWLDTDRPMPECIHELHALAEMHTQNLRSLSTDQGKMYYLTHLDFPSAVSVDLQEQNQKHEEQSSLSASAVDTGGRSTTDPATGSSTTKPPTTMNENDKLERTFLVQCTKEQLIDLGHYMTAQGIFFKKCSDGINTEAHAEIFPASTKTTDGTFRPQ